MPSFQASINVPGIPLKIINIPQIFKIILEERAH